ncbi:hypothetical protein HCBG_03665 [Histoplasma capsulatum G186AR]|uniref:Uncharacterized protein n=2 Tax=Ajellomyces capsulatus TaxID=5037 RepID=C0NKI5_AJECG|nr:uncharacterized protein HCBG_03665 [Histoplasma capsulatum G186AR]EEH08376.1 hypothetical protein HCBG_03665 [Histoplasma capsulatum G186AR]KAG5299312.1 hypothetical protein I7I52_09575 [Histoplasma capsulatum]QSS68068.1 hypothetical protein I7I50_07353 [Histoplasma capsulatum G186AR]
MATATAAMTNSFFPRSSGDKNSRKVELLDLIRQFPVVSVLVPQMGLGDILNLSRVNSHYRAVLHGFALPISGPGDVHNQGKGQRQRIRPDIHIGDHQTLYWKRIKKSGQLLCSEPTHTRGPAPRLCKYCSLPVCEACIVKESFRQSTSAYKSRTRPLCIDCWLSGNPHDSQRPSAAPDFAQVASAYCNCTAKDGWMCSKCREIQVRTGQEPIQTCSGEGCARPPGEDNGRRRICLWCHLPLVARPTMEQWREGYAERHALPEYGRWGELGNGEGREEEIGVDREGEGRDRCCVPMEIDAPRTYIDACEMSSDF